MAISTKHNIFKTFGRGWAAKQHGDRVVKVFGKEAFPRLILLEEKFYAALLCYKRLKNRSTRYGNLVLSQNLIISTALRKLHSDEYFFFTCCGFIYHEILLLREQGLFLDFPSILFDGLKELNDERRHHEHGKDWYWGKVMKNNPPVSSKGIHFDFDRNMKLLTEVYNFITSKIS